MHNANFFTGVIRRNIKADEVFNFFRVIYDDGTGKKNIRRCAGFRVLQKNNRFFIASARHCLNYREKQACDNNFIKIVPIPKIEASYVGSCKKIIISSESDDLFVMEINITQHEMPGFYSSSFLELYPGFKLAGYQPNVSTPLQMFGFPLDSLRGGAPTVTENCEVLPADSRDGIFHLSPEEQQKLIDKSEKNLRETPIETLVLMNKINIVKIKHNCSVYVGNSGGPIRIQGSHDIIGIPSDYWDGMLTSVPKSYSRAMESVPEFVKRHRKILDAEGVEISDRSPDVRLHIRPGRNKRIHSI